MNKSTINLLPLFLTLLSCAAFSQKNNAPRIEKTATTQLSNDSPLQLIPSRRSILRCLILSTTSFATLSNTSQEANAAPPIGKFEPRFVFH